MKVNSLYKQDHQTPLTISLHARPIPPAIHDQGHGIPEAFHDKLFDRFTQSDASSTRHVSGTGLGLAISKVIIEAHNGTIDFTSLENSGTTLYLTVPATETQGIKSP